MHQHHEHRIASYPGGLGMKQSLNK